MRKSLVVVLCLAAMLASISLVVAGESGYANVVTVSPTGADFTSVAAAINSITDASASNRYCVKVYPGTYYGHVACKSYVDVVGASRGSVVLTYDKDYSDTNNYDDSCTLKIAPNMNVSAMTITATDQSGLAVFGEGDDTVISDCTVEGGWTSAMVWGPMSCDRETVINRWVTLRDCNLIGGSEGISIWDSEKLENCEITVNTAQSAYWIMGATINGNSIIRDSHINVTVSGPVTSCLEIGGVVNTDAAAPVRIERTSVNVRVQNQAVGCAVYGIKNGVEEVYVGGTMDIDHCSISVSNAGTGTTHDLISVWWQPGYGCGDVTRVCATKYHADRVSGHIEVMSEGDKSVNNLTVTGNLTLGEGATITLPAKDRMRSFPLLVAGPTNGQRKIMGDPQGSPAIGYSFPDSVTLKKLTLIGAVGSCEFPEPEAWLYLYKNGQVAASVMLVYGVEGTGDQSIRSEALDISLTPQDRISYVLQGNSTITDASIILDYVVD